MKTRVLSVKLSADLYKRFKVKASEEGYLIKDIVIQLVKRYSLGKFDDIIQSKNAD